MAVIQNAQMHQQCGPPCLQRCSQGGNVTIAERKWGENRGRWVKWLGTQVKKNVRKSDYLLKAIVAREVVPPLLKLSRCGLPR